uniref:Uncharacterized protein n=1 Tax=Romanomermis culicivorax TaxID=13658 RepID=A0A915K2T5_ROMCU
MTSQPYKEGGVALLQCYQSRQDLGRERDREKEKEQDQGKMIKAQRNVLKYLVLTYDLAMLKRELFNTKQEEGESALEFLKRLSNHVDLTELQDILPSMKMWQDLAYAIMQIDKKYKNVFTTFGAKDKRIV